MSGKNHAAKKDYTKIVKVKGTQKEKKQRRGSVNGF